MRIKNKSSVFTIVIWILFFLIAGNFGIVSRLFSTDGTQTQVVEDRNMTTQDYHTEIEIREDHSYLVSERIDVDFSNARHGIYRYIPQKGVITELQEDGTLSEIPYYASFDKVASDEPLDVSSDNGNKVFRFGSEDEQVWGAQDYDFQYEVTPITSKGYPNVYYNIFPTGWQNEIPAGSSFTISFPKDFDKDNFQIYYGAYGERMDGADLVDLSWVGNTVSGTLRESLPVGTGMTFFVPMEEGYFQSLHTTGGINGILLGINAAVLLILLLLFYGFGRDKRIIPSVQFHPPQGLDSAAVGYIVDGNVSDTDAMSLLLFWADQGYIRIRETKSKTLALTKMKELPEDAPKYARTFFDGIFGKYAPNIGDEVLVSKLKYKMAATFTTVKAEVADCYSHQVYTKASRCARAAAMILTCVPVFILSGFLFCFTFTNMLVFLLPVLYLIGVILFARTVDFWYSKAKNPRLVLGSVSVAMSVTSVLAFVFVYGIGMLRGTILNLFPGILSAALVSCAGMILTGFMKKRTEQCVEWMGYLAGLRDFIETAELERMKVIAEQSPHLFYHILPFAYVFGLTDLLLDKMRDLSLPAPDWYETRSSSPYFDYYLMHRMMHEDLRSAATTISTPRPASSTGNTGNNSGFFGGSGGSSGGFSGGGFGGGGGGSW